MGKYEVKNEISSDIKNDIKSLLERLNTVEIGSEDYKILYNDFDIRNRELQIVDSIKESNYDNIKKESESVDSRFSFLKKLDDNSVDKLIELTKIYNNNGFYDYGKTFKIPSYINEIKKNGINIEINSVNNIDDLNILIKKINEIKEEILLKINNIKYIYDNYIIDGYLILKNDLETGVVSSNENLEKLREISYPSNYINKIIKLKEEYNNYKKKNSLKKSEEIYKQMLYYQGCVYKEINSFINYKLNSIFNMTNENVNNLDNVLYKYYNMLDILKNILSDLSKTEKEINGSLDIYNRAERGFINNLKLLGIENVDLNIFKEFDKDKYKKYIAYMNVYDRINKSEKKENDDFKLRRKIDDKN